MADNSQRIDEVRKRLKKMSYALVLNTSAVQICHWTKNALRGKSPCWKEKFYGISSLSCCQMTPCVMWCENSCIHCWRPIEMNLGTKLPSVDDPNEIIEKIIEERKKLLVGFKGRKGIDLKKYEESLEPKLFTMSLSGEPTLYPRLGELFKLIRKRGAVSFLVTNGLNPEAIEKLEFEGLPTQITISTNAPNKRLFYLWNRPSKKNAWKDFKKTLKIIKRLKGKVRRVIRLTLVKKSDDKSEKFANLTNMSSNHIKGYSSLIRIAMPDFIHVKGFKSIGFARNRLSYERQPFFEEVLDFSKKLGNELKKDGYKIRAYDKNSCVVMLAKKGARLKIKKV